MSDERRGATLACEAGVPPEQLSAWRDGEQPPEQAQWLARHVAGCPACRERMRDYDRIGAALQRQMIPSPSADPWPAQRRRLAEPRRWAILPRGLAQADRATWSRIGAVVAATLLIALFVALLARQATLRPRPTATPRATATPAANGVWQQVAGLSGQAGLALAPSNPTVAYQFSLTDSKTSTGTHTFTLTMRRTTDQGAHWTNLKPPAIPGVTYPNINGMFTSFISPLNPQVVFLIIEPTNPSTGVCAATNPPTDCAFEFVSANGGQSWQKLSLPAPDLLTALAIKHSENANLAGNLQAQGKRLFGVITTARALGADAPPPPARLVASDDGGVTWKLIDQSFRSDGQGVYSYSVAPAGGEVFAVTESLTQPTPAALTLWHSVDSGSHWARIGALPNQTLLDMRAAWDTSTNSSVLYLESVNAAGDTIIQGRRDMNNGALMSAPALTHGNAPALLTTLRDGSLLIANGGVVDSWREISTGAATTWTQVAQPHGLAGLDSAFTETAANGVTQLWLTGPTQSSYLAEWAQLAAEAPTAPNVTPAASPTASGAAWTSASSLAQASSVAPANLRIQYNASFGATSKTNPPAYVLQRSDDWGQTWKDLTPPQISGVTYPDSLNTIIGAESPVNPQVFILTMQLNTTNAAGCPKNGGRVCQLQYVTSNGGATWQPLALPTAGMLGLSLPFNSISPTDLVAQGSRVYSVVSDVQLATSGTVPPGRLVVSNDGGVTWQLADSALASRGLYVYDLTASPGGSTVYAIAGAMDSSVDLQQGQLPTFSLWRSDDAGATWTKGAALPAQTSNFQLLATTNQATGNNALYLLTEEQSANAALLSYSGGGSASWSASTTISATNDPNVLLASLPSGAVLIGGGGVSGPGLMEWNGVTKAPTTLTQPTGIERIDAAYVTALSGGKIQVFLVGHDQNLQGYWEYTQLTP